MTPSTTKQRFMSCAVTVHRKSSSPGAGQNGSGSSLPELMRPGNERGEMASEMRSEVPRRRRVCKELGVAGNSFLITMVDLDLIVAGRGSGTNAYHATYQN